ncbi:MAG: MFS transporter [Planctomycetia bacterium]|nr:MFS transporter [Planctomycetia bacterium]
MPNYISQSREIVRSYYCGIGKTGLTCVAAFFVAIALGQVMLGLVFYTGKMFNATAIEIGALAGIWALSYALGCHFVRPRFNRFLPRHLIIMATSSALVFTLAMQFAPSLAWMFVLQGLNGVALSLFWPPLMGWLSSALEGKELGKAIARFNISWCLGNVVSPFICGWLSEVGVHLPLLAACGMYLLTIAFVTGGALALPRTRDEDIDNNNSNQRCDDPDQSTLLRYPAWVGLFTAYFTIGVVITIFPAARKDVGMSESTVGTLLLVRGLFNAAVFMFLGKTVFWHFRRAPMLFGQAIGVAALVGLALAHSTYAIGALLAAVGVSVALGYSNSIFHGASGSANRASRMAIHESILAAGLVVGPAVGGIVYKFFSLSAVYWVCAFVMLASLSIQTGLCAWARRRQGGPNNTRPPV